MARSPLRAAYSSNCTTNHKAQLGMNTPSL